MALKSIFAVEVDDSQFREFQERFDKYQESLKASTGVWGQVTNGTNDASEALDKLVKHEREQLAVARMTAFAKGRAADIEKELAAQRAKAENLALGRMDKLRKTAGDYTTRAAGAVKYWASVTGQAKATEGHVQNVTRMMSGWRALSILGSLGGLGGSLYGLDKLAAGAAAARRQSMGTGVPYGKGRAFSLDYSRFTDGDALMGAVGTAKGDATSQQYLGLLSAGISADEIRRKDAADLGVSLFDKLPKLFRKGANDPGFGSTFGALNLDALMSQEDAKRYLNASPEERQAQRKAYQDDSRSMAADPSSLRAWADLDSALGRAKDNIETALVRGLAPLAPQFTTLSGNVATLITDFAKSPEVKADLDSLASGLDTFDKALKNPDSWWNKAGNALNGVAKGANEAGEATHSWLHEHAPWATYDYWAGGGGGAASDARRQLAWMGRSQGLHGDRLKAFVGGGAAPAQGKADAGSPGGDAAARGRVEGNAGQSGWWTAERQSHAVDRLMAEGGLTEDGAKAAVARMAYVEAAGGPTSVNPSSGAEGIAQWLDRKGNGSHGTFDEQLTKYISELNGSEGRAKRIFNTPGREAEGASAFERAEHYGRGNNPGANAGTDRDDYTDRTARMMGSIIHSAEASKRYAAGTVGQPGSAVQAAASGTVGRPDPLLTGLPERRVTDAEVFAARERLAAGGRDPKDAALRDTYLRQQNAPLKHGGALPTTFTPDPGGDLPWRTTDMRDPKFAPKPKADHPDDDRASRSRASDVSYAARGHLSPVQYTKSDGRNPLSDLYRDGFGPGMHKDAIQDAVKAHLGPGPGRGRQGADAGPSIHHKIHDLLYGMAGAGGLGLDKMQRPAAGQRIEVSNATGSNLHVSALGAAYG